MVIFALILAGCVRGGAQPESFGLSGTKIGDAISKIWLLESDNEIQSILDEKYGGQSKNNNYKYYEALGMICSNIKNDFECLYLGSGEIRNDVYSILDPKGYHRRGWITYHNFLISVHCGNNGCGKFYVTRQIRQWKG